jgi:hypothetical protein
VGERNVAREHFGSLLGTGVPIGQDGEVEQMLAALEA